ncbi:MAG TPA: molecular chaperone DnaK, partial [Chloroflexota bacterium]|nr:molecular chaperone DnaK [Chloroflexota bacterium]
KVQDLRSALGTEDMERIKKAHETLTETMHTVSQKMYAAQQAQTPPNGEAPHEEEAKPHDENTVEGEFKEV